MLKLWYLINITQYNLWRIFGERLKLRDETRVNILHTPVRPVALSTVFIRFVKFYSHLQYYAYSNNELMYKMYEVFFFPKEKKEHLRINLTSFQ